MAHFESTDAWTWIDLSALISARRDQSSYHLFSEKHVRGEVWNLSQGQAVQPTTISGNLLIMSLGGAITVTADTDRRRLQPLCQILLNPGCRFGITADSDATVQLIWSPPFAPATADAPHSSG